MDGPQILASQKYIVGQGCCCCRCCRHILGCVSGGGRDVEGGEGRGPQILHFDNSYS